MYRCKIIGLTDSRQQWLRPDVMRIVAEGKVFSGGRRHHEIIGSLLPEGAVWIDITVPLSDTFRKYEDYGEVVIFASGDPLFYGFANTIMRELPGVEMQVYPAFNSMQMLAHKLLKPYSDLCHVSLTGRGWNRFDEALIRGERLIGCLTDRRKTPHAIRRRMAEYGFENYRMYVGENLGNEEQERVGEYDENREYACPNCVLLEQTSHIDMSVGIPDAKFSLLDGRSRMITKMPVRLSALAAMQLDSKREMWDIGFCTGSISIEARRMYPRLHVTAFEIREEGRRLMRENSRKFHAPGIDAVIGDFCSVDIEEMERPDAVFIGGYGGKMEEMLQKVKGRLAPGGCIVFNSVSEKSREAFLDITARLGMKAETWHTITVDANNPITIIRAI